MTIPPSSSSRRALRASFLVAAVVLGPVAAAAEPARVIVREGAAQTSPGSSLEDLLTPSAAAKLTVDVLTARMLDAGPAESARFLRTLEAAAVRAQRDGAPVSHLARVGGTVRRVPAKIASVIGRAEVPRRARTDAIGVALEVLRRDPTERTLATLVALLERGGPVEAADAAGLEPGVVAVVRELSGARIGTKPQVARLVDAASPHLAVAVVDGLAQGGAPDHSLARLVGLLGRTPSLDGALLNRIQIVAGRHAVAADQEMLARIARYLEHDRSFVRYGAAAALGSLGDRENVPDLIALLDDPAGSVREVAHASLKELTSMTIAGDPVRWELWLERQEVWWLEEGQALVARIEAAPRAELIEILRQTCTKRLYHREIAPALLELVERGDVDSIEIALSALGTLRPPSALPAIRQLRDHRDPLVRRRANAALRAYRHAEVTEPLQVPPGLEQGL
ncbi:MAG: HEAT repeat domain-containing protein [Planctomycetota bacterium]